MLLTYPANLVHLSFMVPELWPFHFFTLEKYHTSKNDVFTTLKYKKMKNERYVHHHRQYGFLVVSIPFGNNNQFFYSASDTFFPGKFTFFRTNCDYWCVRSTGIAGLYINTLLPKSPSLSFPS